MHNTLTIDGRSQSLPPGPFHWAHVANTRVDAWRANDAFDYFDGAHDGYAPIEHRRHVLALHGDLVMVADLISGEGTHAAAAHWHLDPRWTAEARGRRATFTRRTSACSSSRDGALDAVSADHAWPRLVFAGVRTLEPTTTIR